VTVGLAMHHKLGGLSTYGLNGQHLGDEHLSKPLRVPPLYRLSSLSTSFYVICITVHSHRIYKVLVK